MSNKSRRQKRNDIYSKFKKAEVKRLLNEGVSISKIAKLLDIHYQLALTYKDLAED